MKLSCFSIILIFILVSCKKIRPNQLTGSWKVVEYAKYTDGEEPVYETGLPNLFLLRYAQGMQINNDGSMLHRFSYDGGNTWETDPSSSYGTWKIKNEKIIFSIKSFTDEDDVIEAEVLKWKDGLLWIKHKWGSHYVEYKLKKE